MTDLIKQLDTIFSHNGKMSENPNFEHRPQQGEMARAVAGALESRSHLLIEAPTGVGKSLAYLIPAILYALAQKRKAIISTHTKNLQEQLLRKDITLALSLIDKNDKQVDVASFKGRRNYLCTTRLRHAMSRQSQLFEDAESDELKQIVAWARETKDGDIESLPFTLRTNIWQQVCSEKGACSRQICGQACFFQRARERARKAPVLIMNHALFFTLLALQSSEDYYLFPDDFVIFDEAHTLENVAGIGIGKNLSKTQVLFAVHRLFNPKTGRGLLSKLRKKSILELCERVERSAEGFFDEIGSVAKILKPSSNVVRITTPHVVANTLEFPLRDLQEAVQQLEEGEKTKINKEELVASRRLLWEAEVLSKEFLERANINFTYWVELHTGRIRNVTLCASPTDVAEAVGPKLFREKTSVIMTSATLSVKGTLEYFQHRLGAQHVRTQILDSPFDFQRQMRIVLAKDIPPPDDPEYGVELSDWIYRSIARSQGKALVLFTSSALLKRIAEELRERLENDGITLLTQERGVSRHALLEAFKKDVHSVLFGLDSFWMGVDVPGEALEHVIITRLPFAVPDHPLTESRMELLAKRGGHAFLDYQLPEAVLKLRQGVGRLIRSKTDTGMVTILDSRILSKQYGYVFVRSLPPCRVEMLYANGETIEMEVERQDP
ncbi:MAG: DEAD/DEAH box helicase [Ignavibacteriae bacterium]|nr:DEAD/DEAH box helicase [Ignavibacteriota bacterium]